MPSGGKRARSGPPKDPNSKRSERQGIAATDTGAVVLPLEGYTGPIPTFPLPKKTTRVVALWKKVWRFPQAAAWATQPWQHLTIAHYCLWAVKAEQPDATPSAMNQVLRLADAIGLTPNGLLMNGWKIADSIEKKEEAEPVASPSPPTRRLRAVNDDVGG